jgi:hypothetical protein
MPMSKNASQNFKVVRSKIVLELSSSSFEALPPYIQAATKAVLENA